MTCTCMRENIKKQGIIHLREEAKKDISSLYMYNPCTVDVEISIGLNFCEGSVN